MRRTCEAAGHKIDYSAIDDSFFCVDCNEWLEANCGCEQCLRRPIRPIGFPRMVTQLFSDKINLELFDAPSRIS